MDSDYFLRKQIRREECVKWLKEYIIDIINDTNKANPICFVKIDVFLFLEMAYCFIGFSLGSSDIKICSDVEILKNKILSISKNHAKYISNYDKKFISEIKVTKDLFIKMCFCFIEKYQ